MPTVTFKAKPETIYNPDETPAFTWIKVPELTQRHCDMAAFRQDRRFSGFANSDMFPGMLRRAVKQAGIGTHIKLDDLPDCVTIERGALLSTVTISLEPFLEAEP